MKKNHILLLALFILLAVPAFAGGRIGLAAGHQFVFMKDGGLISQGVVAEATGENQFGGFGIEYSVYKPFQFGRLVDRKLYGCSLKALFKLDFTEKFNMDLRLGIFDNLTTDSVTVNQIGPVAKISFNYLPISVLEFSFNVEYKTPLLMLYHDTAKFTMFNEHYLMYGLLISFVY